MRAVSEGGFTYLVAPGSPFSAGVSAIDGYEFNRVRFREPMQLEQGLDLVANYLATAGRPPAALAGLELRAPKMMTRPEFGAFNSRYLTSLRARGFVQDENVAVARSNMVPAYEPPPTDVLVAFTFSAPSKTSKSFGPDFLMSGRPEFANNPDRVIAPGDISAAGMALKAGFVLTQLRQSVADLDGHWSDISAVQIYLTQPVELVMPALKAAGLSGKGVTLLPGDTPVIGFQQTRYEFEADLRCTSIERTF
jgi:hypothetical protein